MRKHVKLRLLLLLMALFMLTNCQEEYTESSGHTHEHLNSAIVRKPFKEFKNLPSLLKKAIPKDKFTKARDSTEIYDFVIDSTEVMEVTTDYGRFYTMPITRNFEYPFDMFENLVISDYGNRQEAFIVSYKPDADYYSRVAQDKYAPFTGGMATTIVNYDNIQKTVIRNCITYNVIACALDPEPHPVNESCVLYTNTYTDCITYILDSPVIGGTLDPFKFVNLKLNYSGGGSAPGHPTGNGIQIPPGSTNQSGGNAQPLSPGISGPVTGPMIITKEQEHKDNCNKLKGLINDPAIKSSLSTLKGYLNQNNERLFTFDKNGSGNTYATPELTNSGNNAGMRKRVSTYGVAHTHQNGTTNNPSGIYKMFSIADLQRVYEFAKDYTGSGTTAAPMFFNMMVVDGYTYIVFPDDVEQFKNLGTLFENKDKLERYERNLNQKYNTVGNPDTATHQNLAEHFLKFINNVENNPNSPNLKMSMYRISNENNFSNDWEKLELDPNNYNTLKEPKPCPKN